ncbi:MAG: putative peroxiredoxin bcp [Planctomycetota bacterium]
MSDQDAVGKPLLVLFICNHCPFVKHIRHELSAIGRAYIPKGVAIAAVSSNDPVTYPADGPELMASEACDAGYTFPYLFDANQDVARRFDAQCTPDMYLFDRDHRLVYRGQLDDSRPKSDTPVTGRDLRRALDAVLNGQPPLDVQLPSVGCSIKWRS